MSIFHILTMLGGLAFFLYGMHLLGEGLARVSGGRMESILSRMTDTPLKGVLLGAGATAVIQSSSATTVMVVGFVNAGIMQLSQAVGIIMGANVGTTVTSWILSLSGLESDNVFLLLLKPEAFSPVLAMIGVCFLMFSSSERKKDAGTLLLGFSILMFGMETMSSAMKPLRDLPEFTRLFLAFSNPLLGMFAGAALTAVIQSSSASVGILQALCMTGAVPYSSVLPIIMGQNIGTCVTALLSSIGASANAKRAAFIHLYFNVIGTTVFMLGFYTIQSFVPMDFMGQSATAAGIAVIHSCFNIFATILLLPFSNRLVALASWSVPERPVDASGQLPARLAALSHMDRRFLDNPSFALEQCRKTAAEMLSLAGEAADEAVALLFASDGERFACVEELENYADQYEEKISDYLRQIGMGSLSGADSRELSAMQQCVGHIERIADYALGVAICVKKMKKKKAEFTREARKELAEYCDLIQAVMKHVMNYWEAPDQGTAEEALRLEEELERTEGRILKNHKKRLKKGLCGIDAGFLLADVLSGLRKVAEHSIDIMEAVRQTSR